MANEIMDPVLFFPRHELLKEHIEYYYFLKTEDPLFEVTYFAFPSVNTPLNIHKNVDISILPNFTSVSGVQNENYFSIIQGIRSVPLKVTFKGKIDKVTIAFKPLGINHFLDCSFFEVAAKDSQMFSLWEDRDDYKKFIADFYSINDLEERVGLLENFLISMYRPFSRYKHLRAAIDLLINFESEMSIAEVALKVELNSRTLNRLFREHIGISPAGFKKIARFRHALNNKLFKDQFKRLTDIGNQSNFYDQSYFINIYKKMSGSRPGEFFEKVRKLGNDQLLFRFLEI
jgi:AraC-like DNA-binding protein